MYFVYIIAVSDVQHFEDQSEWSHDVQLFEDQSEWSSDVQLFVDQLKYDKTITGLKWVMYKKYITQKN